MKTLSIIIVAAFCLSGCATLGLGKTRDLCLDSQHALSDAVSAELVAHLIGDPKTEEIAIKVREAAQLAVQINCPIVAPVPPAPASVPISPPVTI